MMIYIRDAQPSDALEQVKLGADGWRSAFKCIVDQAYFDTLSYQTDDERSSESLKNGKCNFYKSKAAVLRPLIATSI